jgi:hypothetical protein
LGRRQETGDRRQETGDRRQETGVIFGLMIKQGLFVLDGSWESLFKAERLVREFLKAVSWTVSRTLLTGAE